MINQFMHAPTTKHLEAVYHIVCYLKSPSQGLLYCIRHDLQDEAFTNVDWTRSMTDRGSTFGYCAFVGGNLFSWCSKKQSVVTQLNVEAEF